MVTQISVSPPPSAISSTAGQDDPSSNFTAPANSSSTSQTSSTSTSTATSSAQNSAPTNFKQALHAARGKQKPAPATQTNTDSGKKTGTPNAKTKGQILTKTVAATTATQTSEVDSEESAEQTEETTDQSNQSAAKPPAPANPILQGKGVKIAKKKTAAASEEAEAESTSPEPTDPANNPAIVQEVTPDPKHSADTGKQQKQPKDSDAKSSEKTAAIENPAVIVSPISTTPTIQPHLKVPAKSSENSLSTQAVIAAKTSATPKPALSSQLQPQPTPPTQSQSVAKSQADHSTPAARGIKPGIKAAKQFQTDPSTDTASASSADTAPDPTITIQSDANVATDPDSPSTTAPATTAQPPAQHTAPTLSAALNALSSVPSPHTTDSTSSTSQAAPTRSFTEANSDQIVTTIKGQLLPDGGTMQITLHPANLGHVHISVQVSAGSVSATFETTNDQATRLLTHNLSQLKQTLESAGVSVEKLQVQQSRDPQPQNQNDSRDQSQQQQSATDQRSAQQEQQRREILQQMWDKISGSQDWVDVKA